jgi:hypothetical protein
MPKTQTIPYGANARPYRAERSPGFRANLATSAQQNPNQSINATEARAPGSATLQHGNLMA